MNYEEMSDFEINKAVAFAVGRKVSDGRASYYQDDGTEGLSTECCTLDGHEISWFDPCNIVSDAWPIIVENKMHIYPEYETKNWIAHAYTENNFFVGKSENPLRAAMIVFLKMQESK